DIPVISVDLQYGGTGQECFHRSLYLCLVARVEDPLGSLADADRAQPEHELVPVDLPLSVEHGHSMPGVEVRVAHEPGRRVLHKRPRLRAPRARAERRTADLVTAQRG